LSRRLFRPQRGSGRVEGKKNLVTQSGFEPRIFQAVNLRKRKFPSCSTSSTSNWLSSIQEKSFGYGVRMLMCSPFCSFWFYFLFRYLFIIYVPTLSVYRTVYWIGSKGSMTGECWTSSICKSVALVTFCCCGWRLGPMLPGLSISTADTVRGSVRTIILLG